MLPQFIQSGFLLLMNPLIRFFTRFRINPNWLTTLGLLLNVAAATAFGIGAAYGTRYDLSYIGWGGAFILAGGICDLLDGKVARAAGLSTRFGALYDSVLDRYSEVIMFIGMGYYLIRLDYFYESIFCFIALGGSTMVSYIRARSESLHMDCKVGLMQRPERIVWLGLGSLFCGVSGLAVAPDFVWMIGTFPVFRPVYIFTIPIFVVAILSTFTSVQRMVHTYRLSLKLQEQEEKFPEHKLPVQESKTMV
jgi:phosphatidylglycerophosphate synthase